MVEYPIAFVNIIIAKNLIFSNGIAKVSVNRTLWL